MKKKQFMGMFALALAVSATSLSLPTALQAASKQEAASVTEAIDGVIYATVDLPFADFYYGEIHQITPTLDYVSNTLDMSKDKVTEEGLRENDQYDAVTSATTAKSKRFEATYFQDNADGSVDIEGIKSAQIAIPETLYNELISEKEKGTSCSNGMYDLLETMTISDSTFSEYKVLQADGTFSMMKTETAIDDDAVATITSNSTWGDYQIDFENIEVDSATMLGAMIEAKDSDGKTHYYGMKHESNLWLNTNEMSFAIAEFFVPQDKTHSVDYKLHEALEGQTITKITYMVKDEPDVVINTNLLVKNQLSDGASIEMSDINLSSSDMVATFSTSGFPADYDFSISSLTCNGTAIDASAYTYDAATKKLTLKEGNSWKAGSYTISFLDNSYVDCSVSFNVNSSLTSKDITIQNNVLTVSGGTSARIDYLDAVETVIINNERYSVSGATIFNTDGSIKFDASTNFHGTTTTYFSAGENADYTIEIQANGYPSISGTVGKSYASKKDSTNATTSAENNSTQPAETGTTGNPTDAVSSVNLGKTTVKVGKTAKKTIRITWKKVANASSYQIQYSLKKNFKGAKTVTVSASKNSAVLKKLKGKKTYYIRVKSYAATGTATASSSWSKTKVGRTK